MLIRERSCGPRLVLSSDIAVPHCSDKSSEMEPDEDVCQPTSEVGWFALRQIAYGLPGMRFVSSRCRPIHGGRPQAAVFFPSLLRQCLRLADRAGPRGALLCTR